MNLAMLAAMVVAGVGAVVLAVHLSGGSVAARLADPAAARARFAIDFPDLAIGAVHLTLDGGGAFLALGDGRVGIVKAVGDRFLTRVVSGPDLADAPRLRDSTLVLGLRDFTWPGGTFTFAGPDEARAVERLLAALPARA